MFTFRQVKPCRSCSCPQQSWYREGYGKLSSCRRKTRQSLQCHAVFNFGKAKPEEKKYANNMSREEYTADDVQDYFNYMGMLAAEGTYDSLEKELQTGSAPVDILLLMAASENDAPKVAELLRAGAKLEVKNSEGKSAGDLTSSDVVKELLEDREKASTF